jgi:hypothetical protein
VQATVAAPPADCALWPFPLDTDGYGRVWDGARTWPAHRLALILHTGHDPGPALLACHAPVVCHARACINPQHLRWATNHENIADRRLDGTTARGSRIGLAKLTEADVRAIRADPRPASAVARAYGIGTSTVNNVRYRRTWRHVVAAEETRP